jgi:cobalt-zinc-cadmium efflux system outer membrane protein
MTSRSAVILGVLVLGVGGCAAMPPTAELPSMGTESSTPVSPDASSRGVVLAAYADIDAPKLVQPAGIEPLAPVALPEVVPSEAEGRDASPAETRLPSQRELVTPTEGPPFPSELTLEVLQSLAIANNPAISQAAARVSALQGKWVQVGLPPNPTAGYVGSEIGNDGAAGQQGGYVGQDFITGKKLQRNRNIVAAEIARAQQELAATQARVRTDVRRAYYGALLAQRRIELAQEMLRVTRAAAEASQSLVDAEEIPLAGLLQTQIQQQNAQVFAQTAGNVQAEAWRRLSAVVNQSELPIQPLAGDVGQLPELMDWHSQQNRIQAMSPELAAAFANLERARRALGRARVEAVPDISTQASVQYDDSSDDTISGVQIGMPIPLWNRNQGGIRQAECEVAEAVRNVSRVEQHLNERLATAYRRYADAHVTATNYASAVLPRSQQALDLVRKGYEQGEVGYLDLLAAQQTYSQTNLAYLEALGSLWESYVLIDGLLLEGSLAASP